MFNWIQVNSGSAYSDLSLCLKADDFAIHEVSEWMARHLSEAVGGVLVEHPFVDDDYRSTYYNFYARKTVSYSLDAARLHIFRKGWGFREQPIGLVCKGMGASLSDETVAAGYLGFITLRPTRSQTIGTTILSPLALREVKGWLIEHQYKVDVMGYNVYANGYPFMQQPGDIAVCAHVVCWSVLRHFSAHFSSNSSFLVHDVSRLGNTVDSGGLLASLGITAGDAERIFSTAGTTPLIVSDGGYTQSRMCRFHDEMLAYLESGFPLFGIQYGRQHAVSIIGFRQTAEPQSHGEEYRRRHWDFVSHLVVVDDNHQPYMPVSRHADGVGNYSIADIEAFIVPLPREVFLPAAAALNFADLFVAAPPPFFDYLRDSSALVSRCFIVTNVSWQRFIRQHISCFQADFASASLELTLPKFLWVVEYATAHQRAKGQITARLLLDANAGARENMPMFLIHDRDGALWLDRVNRVPMQYQKFNRKLRSQPEMPSDLREYR